MFHKNDELVPGYRLECRIGRGAFGEVWRASGPGVRTALKILDVETGQAEYQALQKIKNIRHANLLPINGIWLLDNDHQVMDVEQLDEYTSRSGATFAGDGGRPQTLVVGMPLADLSLSQRLEQHRAEGRPGIPSSELVGFLYDAAQGLDYLNRPIHDMGSGSVAIQHCDVKPQNILIFGGSAVVGDFGVIRIVGATRATSLGGTPAYLAPEFIKNHGPSHASDQYALAITYAHLRTGELPFEADSYTAVLNCHLHGRLDFSALPAAERQIIIKATSIDPDDRYANNVAMVRALQQVACPQRQDDISPSRHRTSDIRRVDRCADASTHETSTRRKSQRRRRTPNRRAQKLRWFLSSLCFLLVLAGIAVWKTNLLALVVATSSPSVPALSDKRAADNKKDHNASPKTQRIARTDVEGPIPVKTAVELVVANSTGNSLSADSSKAVNSDVGDANVANMNKPVIPVGRRVIATAKTSQRSVATKVLAKRSEKADAAKRRGVRWMAKFPGLGQSKPAVSQQLVLLNSQTSSTKHSVLAFARNSGELVWQRDIPCQVAQIPGDCNSPVTDDNSVFAQLGSTVVAFDMAGKMLWQRVLDSEQTLGDESAMAIHGKLLFVFQPLGLSSSRGSGILYGLDKATGRTVWSSKTLKGRCSSLAVYRRGSSHELIVGLYSADDTMIQAYDATTGRVTWATEGKRAVVDEQGGAIVIFARDGLMAFQPKSARATITATKLWHRHQRHGVDSGVIHNDYLYVTGKGVLQHVAAKDPSETQHVSCLEVQTGRIMWSHPLGESPLTAPQLVNGNLYMCNRRGDSYVVRADPKFRLLATSKLDFEEDGTKIYCSVASTGQVFLCGDRLYCIEHDSNNLAISREASHALNSKKGPISDIVGTPSVYKKRQRSSPRTKAMVQGRTTKPVKANSF